MSYWYCNDCKRELCPENVTFEEKCDTCGHNAIWIETEDDESVEQMLQELKERRESSLRPATSIQNDVIKAVLAERQRQDKKWGEQNHPPQFWTGILGEEFGELCQAINETVFDNGEEERKKGGYENMYREAIHVAAVAVGFLECLERNRGYYCESSDIKG